jgi:Na+/H+-dicarboxylate symporter
VPPLAVGLLIALLLAATTPSPRTRSELEVQKELEREDPAVIAFGPYILNVFPSQVVFKMDLFTNMALAIIAFSIGAAIKLETIKKKKKVILGITYNASCNLCSSCPACWK